MSEDLDPDRLRDQLRQAEAETRYWEERAIRAEATVAAAVALHEAEVEEERAATAHAKRQNERTTRRLRAAQERLTAARQDYAEAEARYAASRAADAHITRARIREVKEPRRARQHGYKARLIELPPDAPLSRLSERQRTVLALRQLHSREEAAQVLGISMSKVSNIERG